MTLQWQHAGKRVSRQHTWSDRQQHCHAAMTLQWQHAGKRVSCQHTWSDGQQQTTTAYRDEGVQEVEGLVNGGVSINVALGDELVMDDSL